MALCPFAVKRLLPENQTQGRITPRAIILHTAVDSASPNSSIYGYFSRGDVSAESHFYVLDNGTIEQYIDTDIRADANGSANGFAISIETEDDGNPAQNGWTDAQITSLLKLIEWCCTTHNIPWRQIPSTTGAGIGWHSMWGFNTVSNKSINPWTSAVGKTCPGGPRIAQSKIIIAKGNLDVAGEVADQLVRDMAGRITNTGKAVYDFVFVDRALDIIFIRAQITTLTAAVAALAGQQDNDITEARMQEMLEDVYGRLEQAVRETGIDVEVHVPAQD